VLEKVLSIQDLLGICILVGLGIKFYQFWKYENKNM